MRYTHVGACVYVSVRTWKACEARANVQASGACALCMEQQQGPSSLHGAGAAGGVMSPPCARACVCVTPAGRHAAIGQRRGCFRGGRSRRQQQGHGAAGQ
jgi:hypothetical protein